MFTSEEIASVVPRNDVLTLEIARPAPGRTGFGQASSPERMRGSTMVNGWLRLFGIAMHRPLDDARPE